MMMWRLLIALIGLSMTDVNSFAQSDQADRETPQAERLASERSPSEIGGHDSGHDDPDRYAGYLGPSGVVRFQLIQGRISLDSPRHRKGSQSCNENGIYESVSVTAKRGIPSVLYISQTNHQHLKLSVQDARTMRIESWLPNHLNRAGQLSQTGQFSQADQARFGQRCVIHQPASGQITFSCTSGDQTHQRTGATLLHVRGLHPILFDQHFGRLLTRMLHGQSLKELSENTRKAVLAELKSPIRITELEIHRCIEGLGSKQRKQRIDAQRKLMDGGTLVVPALRARLDASSKSGDLDVEQIARMERILNRLRSRSPDRPRSLAKLLVNDPSYWTIVADGMSSEQRQLAASRQRGFRVFPASQRPAIRVAGR